MGVVTSHKREIKDIDWGFVGDIDRVDAEMLWILAGKKDYAGIVSDYL